MVKEYIRELIDKWKVHRLLKNSGCKTIEEYEHIYDPLIDIKSNTVSQFYHGYPYVVRIPFTYTRKSGDWLEGIELLTEWCQSKCKERWRKDWHRVYCTYGIKGTILEVHDIINEIGGSDFIYFAFVCQKDYNWFVLSHELND